MFKILAIYGSPKELINVIERLHKNFHLELKLKKENCVIPYTVGVRQGDNMAPTLFLFLMMAFFTTFQKKWKNEEHMMPTFKDQSRKNQGTIHRQKNLTKVK